MKKALFSIALCCSAVCAGATETTAGQLSAVVTADEAATLTSLTLTGSMDARDFAYVQSSMPKLEQLDLTGVTIEEYSDKMPVFANFTYYPANELPKYGLMGIASLTSVVLPSTITSVGEGAMAGCTGIATLALPASVTTVDASAFSGMTALTAVSGGEGVQTIGDYAFSHCSALTAMPQMAQLASVGTSAFVDDKALSAFTFPQSLQTIGESAFQGCALTAVNLSACPNLTVVGAWAFADNASLQSASLPASVTSLGDGAFFYSSSLQSVALPEGLAKINDYTFMGGKAVQTATLPETVTEIGDYALSDWSEMTQFVLPASVEKIGTRAMRGWTALVLLESKATTPPTLGESVWEGVKPENVKLVVPESSTSAYMSAEQWKDFFDSSTVKNLSDEAFKVESNGDIITLRSTSKILSYSLFGLSGILLKQAAPNANEATMDLSAYSGKAYVVRCVTEKNNVKTIKISRQ